MGHTKNCGCPSPGTEKLSRGDRNQNSDCGNTDTHTEEVSAVIEVFYFLTEPLVT